MTETPTKEGRGRPAIETRELPPDIRIAIQARSQGLTWKAAADRAGTTATRVRGFMQTAFQARKRVWKAVCKTNWIRAIRF